jgi:hypothetical protein
MEVIVQYKQLLYLISIKTQDFYCIILNAYGLCSLLCIVYVVIGSSAMLNGHCNDPEEYDRISCSAASETQVILLNQHNFLFANKFL